MDNRALHNACRFANVARAFPQPLVTNSLFLSP
jgi:hypothetical protein